MALYSIKSHKVPTSYIREYPQSTSWSQEDELHLAVKQYTPLDNQSPKDGDVTIIGAHANAFPKVCPDLNMCKTRHFANTNAGAI